MPKIEDLIGSIEQDQFIQALIAADKDQSLGSIWEKCCSCPECAFHEQCEALGGLMEAQGKNPTCGQMIDLLLGHLSPTSAAIRPVPYFNKINRNL